MAVIAKGRGCPRPIRAADSCVPRRALPLTEDPSRPPTHTAQGKTNKDCLLPLFPLLLYHTDTAGHCARGRHLWRQRGRQTASWDGRAFPAFGSEAAFNVVVVPRSSQQLSSSSTPRARIGLALRCRMQDSGLGTTTRAYRDPWLDGGHVARPNRLKWRHKSAAGLALHARNAPPHRRLGGGRRGHETEDMGPMHAHLGFR